MLAKAKKEKCTNIEELNESVEVVNPLMASTQSTQPSTSQGELKSLESMTILHINGEVWLR